VEYGAIVNEVVDDSPAAESELQEDDIIIAFNGEKVTDAEELTDLVQESNPGDEVTLTVQRGNSTEEITVTLDSRRYRDTHWGWSHAPHTSFYSGRGYDRHGYLGVSVDDLSEQLGDYFGVRDGDGALISSVEEDSPAEAAGLTAGDIIVAIDDEDVYDASDAVELVRDYEEGDQVTIHIIRDKQRTEVTAELEERRGSRAPWVISVPDVPPIDVHLPKMRGLYRSLGDLDEHFDYDEYEDEMEELRRELRELKRELKELKR
jgi:S1-C subfamily serine protease